MRLRRFTLTLLALIFTAASSVHAISPLPPRPEASGPELNAWIGLRSLRTAVDQWLDPDSENYIYADVRADAPTGGGNLAALTHVYESLLADNQAARENAPEARARARLALAIYGNLLGAESGFRSLLLKIQRAPEPRPRDSRDVNLSLRQLSGKSPRALFVLDSLIANLRGQIETLEARALKLAFKSTGFDGPAAASRLDAATREYQESSRTLALLLAQIDELLPTGVDFANRFVRDRGLKNREDVERRISDFGKNVQVTLAAIDKLGEKYRATGADEAEYVALGGARPARDLGRLVTRVTQEIPAALTGDLGYQPAALDRAVEIYREAVIVQSLLTVGAMLAKVNDVRQVRGHFGLKRLAKREPIRAALDVRLWNEFMTNAKIFERYDSGRCADALLRAANSLEPTLKDLRAEKSQELLRRRAGGL